MMLRQWIVGTSALWALGSMVAAQDKNLVVNPSFEDPAAQASEGQIIPKWIHHLWEGECDVCLSDIAHSGRHSAALVGRTATKMRLWQERTLEPGRYRTTAYLRGFDIGLGQWRATTELMFDEHYINLDKNGTFGWTKITYVGAVTTKKKVMGPSFGLFAPGYLWIDDVTLEKVGDDVPLTPKPVFEKEESPLVPPGKLDGTAMRCPRCTARNMAAWKTCYVCGADLSAKKAAVAAAASAGPAIKLLADFQNKNPFNVGDSDKPSPIVDLPGAKGVKASRLDKSYDIWAGDQNWSGYDYLRMDLYTAAKNGLRVYFEFYDLATVDYWTRGQYQTTIPPGLSTITIPIGKMCVGEKSSGGQRLNLAGIKKYAVMIDEKPAAPLLISNVRLERAVPKEDTHFDGLFAFDFQSDSSTPVMNGFTPVFPSSIYSEIKGYGLKNTKTRPQGYPRILEPDSLYEAYFYIDSGEFLVDVPNGRYRVFLNVNVPPGFWGDRQEYETRTILAQGKPVVDEVLDDAARKKRFFKHFYQDDLPTDNVFDKYEKSYEEKIFDVQVTDGQLRLGFAGKGNGNAPSALVVFPLDRLPQGERFLRSVVEDRRFEFDTQFKRSLHPAAGDPLVPSQAEKQRGYVTFVRDLMKEVYYNDTPLKEDLGRTVAADAFAGEYAPMTLAVSPLRDLGKVSVTIGDLAGPGGTIPASAIDVGYVSYRLGRLTLDGAIYSIVPRYVMPSHTVDMPKDIVRRFWLTAKVPAGARAGLYQGALTVKAKKGGGCQVPVALRVRAGTLDELDIPAGPWGYEVPFSDPANVTSLKKIREYGFTLFSSGVMLWFSGIEKDGTANLGFPWVDRTDKLMATAKELGFKAVMYYGSMVGGYNAYQIDTEKMRSSGFNDYSQFLKTIYTAVDKRAKEKGWIPYYVNLCDEPRDQGLTASIANAEAYRKAFPKGPPLFTGATSVDDVKDKDHLRLAKALHIANLNGHSEESVKAIHDAGGDWAFYNAGDRWTFGDYMYKAAKEFGLKFRIDWYWNATGGDPYYALDCREDEFCWCNVGPDGQLIPAVVFELNREGLGDYRRLLTLQRLAKEKAGSPAAQAAAKLIKDRMASFKLGQRDHDALFGADDWQAFRAKVNDAIEALRK
ncbi:MAG: hypothetical protein ABSG86_12075 [Thermoguttaceae bacterium]